MKIEDIRRNAFAMPLTSPAFPPGPYRFVRREFLIVTYRTDIDALRAVVPEPLEVVEPQISCSRSFRTSTAQCASASWFAIT